MCFLAQTMGTFVVYHTMVVTDCTFLAPICPSCSWVPHANFCNEPQQLDCKMALYKYNSLELNLMMVIMWLLHLAFGKDQANFI